MQKHWKVMLCLCIFIFAVIVGIRAFLSSNNEPTYSFATLKTQSQYVVDIRAARSWEISQSIYCTVLKDGERIFSVSRIGSTGHEPNTIEFALVETEEGLVALVEKIAPHIVLMLYDLKNHTSWWLSDPTATWQEQQAFQQEFLQRLNESVPGTPFVSSDEVGYGDHERNIW